jgi:hypothetical protein
MNTLGLICAAATFLGVWLGHVSVRYIEAQAVSIRLPALMFTTAGLALLTGSLLVPSVSLSAALAILGVTVLVDVAEFFHQEQRVINGRAPANPRNPRHRRILAEHASATTVQ